MLPDSWPILAEPPNALAGIVPGSTDTRTGAIAPGSGVVWGEPPAGGWSLRIGQRQAVLVLWVTQPIRTDALPS